MKIATYLNFNGECEEAFNFYRKALDGKIEGVFRWEDAPKEVPMPPEMAKKVMHVTLAVGEELIMGCDCPPGQFDKPQGFAISLNLDDINRAEQMFNALADGGKISMPLQATFWAKKFGMLTDRFGISWMVNCSAN